MWADGAKGMLRLATKRLILELSLTRRPSLCQTDGHFLRLAERGCKSLSFVCVLVGVLGCRG